MISWRIHDPWSIIECYIPIDPIMHHSNTVPWTKTQHLHFKGDQYPSSTTWIKSNIKQYIQKSGQNLTLEHVNYAIFWGVAYTKGSHENSLRPYNRTEPEIVAIYCKVLYFEAELSRMSQRCGGKRKNLKCK